MASRTRERLIDVARQLFARKGLENTTMNDIATASDRGRRTIYTYFRTKDDIYQAVIEDEANHILSDINQQLDLASTPAEKLQALLNYRSRLALGNPHGYEVWLKALFNRDKKRAVYVRNYVNSRLYDLTEEIVDAGIKSGDFIPEQARRLPAIIATLIRNTDTSATRDAEQEFCLKDGIDFIIAGVMKPTK